MLQLIEKLPYHLRHAWELSENSTANISIDSVENIVICGLGGSGIGATMAYEIYRGHLPVPMIICKDYDLPAFVNQNTFVVACSYSGNTEETLETVEQAMQKGAQIAVITSGGKLLQTARKHNFWNIIIPDGQPPRGMLGYSLTALLYVINKTGFTYPNLKNEISRTARMLEAEQENIKSEAEMLAQSLRGKVLVTYACEGISGVATRWRQQFNENAKMVGWDAAIPEMNHNELVGWAGGNDGLAVMFLHASTDHPRSAKRAELNASLIKRHTPHVFDIPAKGSTHLEQLFYLIHFGDWISYHLSNMNGVDIVEVNVITELKTELSRF